jgi:uncharacterized protein with von Willebrand factor type A (vWA) domain
MQLVNNFIIDFMRTLGGMSAAILVLAYLSRVFLAQRLSRDMEVWKADLKAMADKDVERLKVQLSASLNDREIRLSALHTRVIEAVSEIHARIYRVQAAIKDYTRAFEPTGSEPIDRRAKRVARSLANLKVSFETKAIFLPQDLYEEIFGFHKRVSDTAHEFQLFIVQQIDPGQRMERWQKIEHFTSEESPKLLKALRNRFQFHINVADKLPRE